MCVCLCARFHFQHRSIFSCFDMFAATAAATAATATADAVAAWFKCVYNMVLKRVWRISGKSKSNNTQLKPIIWMSVKCYYSFYWFVLVVIVVIFCLLNAVCIYVSLCFQLVLMSMNEIDLLIKYKVLKKETVVFPMRIFSTFFSSSLSVHDDFWVRYKTASLFVVTHIHE